MSAKPVETSSRTYATRENAINAFRKVYGTDPEFNWTIATTPDGRFFPLCIGQRALAAGTHFHFATTN